MSDKPKVYVAGVGMITPVGFDAASTTAAVRAGVSAYKASEHYNKNYNPMRMAVVPEDALPPLNPSIISNVGLTSREQRMLRLVAPALEEVMQSVSLTIAPPLLLAVPESLPESPISIKSKFLDYLVTQTGIQINKPFSRIMAKGRAGGIKVVEMAFKYFDTTGNDAVLIGGVDTYIDNNLLGRLDYQDRILAEEIMDGFVPGEAAGFMLLVSSRVIDKLPHRPLASLSYPGIAEEKGHLYSEEPYTGEGLALAFHRAIEQADSKILHSIYASLNGESLGAKEYGVAYLRNKSAFAEDLSVVHPADCFGDIGAAFGPVLMGIAALNKNTDVMCYCSSDMEMRAAIHLNVLS
jgi:3-oxoacyl-[acyl-carrier-protein] synthase-1